LIDCADLDCAGTLKGDVTDEGNNAIVSADVDVKQGLTSFAMTTTNPQGTYNIDPLLCGTYYAVASHADYTPETQNFVVAPNQNVIEDFQLTLGSSCDADCTFTTGNIIHASCEGRNGCTFYDSTAMAACDNAQPGWIRDYDVNKVVNASAFVEYDLPLSS